MIRAPRLLRRPLAALFPGVRWIETRELADLLERHAQLVLLDARSRAEHALSRLPGAHHLDFDAPDLASLEIAKHAPIIVYCSVGYRSALLCKRLAELGYTDTRNLAGGIFQWANEHHALEADTGGTARVHPYNRIWGLCLAPDLRAKI